MSDTNDERTRELSDELLTLLASAIQKVKERNNSDADGLAAAYKDIDGELEDNRFKRPQILIDAMDELAEENMRGYLNTLIMKGGEELDEFEKAFLNPRTDKSVGIRKVVGRQKKEIRDPSWYYDLKNKVMKDWGSINRSKD